MSNSLEKISDFHRYRLSFSMQLLIFHSDLWRRYQDALIPQQTWH